MQTIFTTNDLSEIAFIKALLSAEGINFHIADENMSFLEGSIGIIPRRIMVQNNDVERAITVLIDNGFSL